MAKHKVYLTDIIENQKEKEYKKIYDYILEQIEQGILSPIKASGSNGKTPSLYNAYWKVDEEVDYSEYIEEMKFRMSPMLDLSYYMNNPKWYIKDRMYIQLLSEFFVKQKEQLEIPLTVNERSFQIFHREKYLSFEGGAELLRHLNMSLEALNVYETAEPLSYYSHSKTTPQKFLIIENKDTFYSMRKHLTDGKKHLLNVDFQTLIYGAGKRIYKSFEDYENGVETYFLHSENTVWYFGDLDYEGILIYEKLANMYQTNIKLFVPAYERMLKKAQQIGFDKLPDTKEGQNRNIGEYFFRCFDKETVKIMKEILEQGKYIPQEILNEGDYGEEFFTKL